MGFDYSNNKIYIHRKIGKPLYIGIILSQVDTLYIHDRDNYLIPMNGLGVDEEVIMSKILAFHYIQMKWKGEKLITTRKYFFDHCKGANMFNGRTMLFMPIAYFGLDKALAYEQMLKSNKLAQMSIFDVAEKIKETNSSNLLSLWLKSVDQAEKANQKIKKEKGIIL